nr:sulfurtransferase [uncultured Bacillus sp.]
MTILVNHEWLKENLDDVRLVDCRFNLGNSEEGEALYKENHLPGAVYAHLERDLSGPVRKHGGRHPLPDMEQIRRLVETYGIEPETKVVAYDGGEGAFAARLWWLLTYAGHRHTFVLNGGYNAWIRSGYPVNSDIPVYEHTVYPLSIRDDLYADVEDVRQIVNRSDKTTILIDSREERRYAGEFESIDKKAGHIPTAVNKVWTEGLEDGYFLPPDRQKARFSEWSKDQPLIVYCGSGVTAVPNFMALKDAGFQDVRLYLGSFSDWISYDDHPVAVSKKA